MALSRIVVILGSVRRERNGARVAGWLRSKLEARGHSVDMVDPAKLNLPLLDRMYKEMDSPSSEITKLHDEIKNADGYILITPEYNHSVSAALKNTLDYFLEEYFFKPSAIVSYSVGGFGGNLAGAHLRQIMAELGAPAIPSSLAISRVDKVIDSDGTLLDEAYDRRADRFLAEFDWYAEALAERRKKGTPY